MELEEFDQNEYEKFMKMGLKEAFKKYQSLTKQNKKTEAVMKQMMNEQIIFVNKNVYELYDSTQSKERKNEKEIKVEIDEKNSATMLSQFKEYINNIDISSDNNGGSANPNKNNSESLSLNDRKEINQIIKHEFGKDLKINEFLNGFNKAIVNNVNKNWEKDQRIELRNYLEEIFDSEIKSIFYKKIPRHIMQLRMDNILSTVLAKIYKSKDKILEYLIIKASIDYSLVPLKKGIEFLNPDDGKKYLFNKEFIKKQITNNVGIINSYYKLIQKFVTNKFDKTKLKETLTKIIDETNIYFCNMPKKVLGLTICNGDIFISGKLLQESIHYSPNNKIYNLTGVSKIYLTLLHEIAHKLQYTLRMTYNVDDNYFIKTFYFKKENDLNFDIIQEIEINGQNYDMKDVAQLNDNELKVIIDYKNLHGNKTRCESGDFFDMEIYLGKEQKLVTKSISKFFLLSACKKYNDYIRIMKSFLEKINDPEERTTNSNYKLIDDEKVYCYYSYIRRNEFND